MKLGHAYEITVHVEDLKQATDFYRKLGFRQLNGSPASGSAVRFSDGAIVLAVEPSGQRRSTLTYFTDALDDKISGLKNLGIEVSSGLSHGGAMAATFRDPSGQAVSLVQGSEAAGTETGDSACSKCGQFGELSLETDDVEGSKVFWEKLGFGPTQWSPQASAEWASLTDGLLMLGLYKTGHCPHVFESPAITYFNEDAVERNQLLKTAGVEFLQELDGGQGVVAAPEGQHLFLFGV